MLWLDLVVLLTDSILGAQYQWRGLSEKDRGMCAEAHIISTDRPLVFLWQEESPAKKWVTVKRILIERWDVPKIYTLCREGEWIGRKVRILLTTVTSKGPQVILYEGYPWGEPPSPPDLILEQGKESSILRVKLSQVGIYVLRAYNQFGEEVFTIPLEAKDSKQFEHTFVLPKVLRGSYLIQLYSLNPGILLVEKPIHL